MKKIAVLGLGAMGLRMAKRLLMGGQEVTVFNRTPERADEIVKLGARRVMTPREAVGGVDIVLCCVSDDQASRDVWLEPATGALQSLHSSTVVIESSTLTPDWVRTLAEQVHQRGAAFLDAPVSGSRPQAEAAKLVFLVGGEVQSLERVRDTLLLMGCAIHHVGPVGAGAVMKLCVNALLGVEVAALAEVLQLARRAGVPEEEAQAVIAQTAVASPVIQAMGNLIVARQFAPQFPIDLVQKDLRYAVTTLEQLGGRARLVACAREAFAQAGANGHGDENITAIAREYE